MKAMKPLPSGLVEELRERGIRVTEYATDPGIDYIGKSYGEWVDDDQTVIGVRKGDLECLMVISNEMIEYAYPGMLAAMIAQQFD